jgi:hypothetical protein
MGIITFHPANEADYQLLIELAKRLNVTFTATETEPTISQEEFLSGLERSVEEIKNHQKGVTKLRSAYDLLNEL